MLADEPSVNAKSHKFSKETREHFWRAVDTFLGSDEGHRAIWMLVALLAFVFAINGLNVVNSYVGRDFISAIEHRNHSAFILQAWKFVGVFALSTVAAVIYRYFEERLGLVWREWQTREILDSYVDRRAYYLLEQEGQLQNADQRIAEDVRTFTTSTLSFVLMTLNASVTVLTFSGVLWSISPRLFLVAVAYAAAGSLVTVLVGRRLIGLNVSQLDKEANFRSELIRLREHAEPIAVLHRERTEHRHLLLRLAEVVANTRKMISVNRNLGFFTNGYNYLIQIIPALIVAPLFIDGKVEFGVVTQSAMAFAMLMGAFSLAVTQFQLISTYAAVIARLGSLIEAIDRSRAPATAPIEIAYDNRLLAFEGLSLRRADGQVLLRDLNIRVERGSRVLISSDSGYARGTLFEATAGLRCSGAGRIVRPDADSLLLVPERPYLAKVSVRELLCRPQQSAALSDAEIRALLQKLQLDAAVQDAGGLDVEHDWNNLLGSREQASLVIAQVLLARPAFAYLDRMTLSMDSDQAAQMLQLFEEAGISYLVNGKPGDFAGRYDAALHIAADGSWSWRDLRAG